MSANLQEQIVTRPILFSGPMVRALLDGRKTQTRRIVKAKDSDSSRCITLPMLMKNVNEWRLQDGRWFGIDGYDTLAFCDCPYGNVGDRLWVREAHALLTMMDGAEVCAYRASCDDNTFNYVNEFTGNVHCIQVERWRPSIHMPRKASRITLEITDVRVEQLNAISEDDAKAEGTDNRSDLAWGHGGQGDDMARWAVDHGHRYAFCHLWDSINGDGAWSLNPWVWVVQFKVV